jgi:very-short-patch-repair endonuclease
MAKPMHPIRRQISRFVVDSLCVEAALVIKLDGGQHNRSVTTLGRPS